VLKESCGIYRNVAMPVASSFTLFHVLFYRFNRKMTANGGPAFEFMTVDDIHQESMGSD
jgi:hypothetical protein